MKTFLTIASFFILMSSSFAGPITSGGGYSVVCRDTRGAILKAELLDLYEAKHKFGFHLVESKNDVKEDYKQAFDRITKSVTHIDPFPMSQIDSAYDWFFKIAQFLPAVSPINDIGNHPPLPIDCKLEQVAIFFDLNYEVQVNLEIWDHFDSLNRAGLIIHELLYRQNRELRDLTSENTRATVSCMFSNDCPANNHANLPEFNFTTVNNELSSRTVFQYLILDQKITLYLKQLEGRTYFSETTATFDIGNIEFFQAKDYISNHVYFTTNVQSVVKIRSQLSSILLENNKVIELTLAPNRPVVISLYENDVLISTTPVNYFDFFTPGL